MVWLEKKLLLIAAVVVLTMMIIGTAVADPAGSGVLTGTSSRGTGDDAGNLTAQGGNVTNVDITASSITEKWQGFYGDITGAISLENAGGNVFYNWTDTSPTGEVFATRNPSTPTWASVDCASAGQILTESAALLLSSGADNITNTFCEVCGNHTAFDVGISSFTADECTYRTNAFGSSGAQTTNWDQVILHDTNYPIYTTLIDQDTAGFDAGTYDFQLLVADNSTALTTTYFFYVEIV